MPGDSVYLYGNFFQCFYPWRKDFGTQRSLSLNHLLSTSLPQLPSDLKLRLSRLLFLLRFYKIYSELICHLFNLVLVGLSSRSWNVSSHSWTITSASSAVTLNNNEQLVKKKKKDYNNFKNALVNISNS